MYAYQCKCDATHILADEGVYRYKMMLSKDKIIHLIIFNLQRKNRISILFTWEWARHLMPFLWNSDIDLVYVTNTIDPWLLPDLVIFKVFLKIVYSLSVLAGPVT